MNAIPLEDVAVRGSNLESIMRGFGNFTLLASRILLDEKIGKEDPSSGMAIIESDQWYPANRVLKVLARVGAELGDSTLRQLGTYVGRNSELPPSVFDVQTALKGVDAIFHMSHALRGEPMFLPRTGEMKDGIGHYVVLSSERRKCVIESNSPYPCGFDEGMLLALAQRFGPLAMLAHDRTKPCRKTGGDCCTYTISW